MSFLLWCLGALILVTLTVLGMRRDPRWLGNAVLLPLALLAVVGVLMMLKLGGLLALTLLIAVVAAPLAVVVLIVLLTWNGVELIRREGCSPAHALSLLLAFGLAALVALDGYTVLRGDPHWFAAAVFAMLVAGWFGMLLLGYVGYGFVYAAIAGRRRPDFVVTLGSGLVNGRVPPLLAARIELALGYYRSGVAAGRPPVLVMSGGRGPDEPVAEGRAMADYAIAHGVPAADVVIEGQSRTTEENLRFTGDLVRADPRLGSGARGIAVTSNYHALRAAVLARSLGLPIDAAGAKVAWYFWPSAMLREFVAVLRPHGKLHAVVAGLVSVPLPLFLYYAQTH